MTAYHFVIDSTFMLFIVNMFSIRVFTEMNPNYAENMGASLWCVPRTQFDRGGTQVC